MDYLYFTCLQVFDLTRKTKDSSKPENCKYVCIFIPLALSLHPKWFRSLAE